jgi:hypothetical protein
MFPALKTRKHLKIIIFEEEWSLENYPFWLPNKKNAFTYLLFIVLFILSLDFWGWGQSKPLLLGMPLWVYYILILTLITSFIFYLFIKVYWRDDE